jgi:hypothetical protein
LNARRTITISIIDEISLQDFSEGYLDIKDQKHEAIETLEDFLSFEPELTKKGVVVIYDGEPKEGQHQITVKNINKYSMLQFRYRIIEPKNDKKLFMVQNYKDGKKVVDSKNYLNISDLYKGLVEEILNDVKFYF